MATYKFSNDSLIFRNMVKNQVAAKSSTKKWSNIPDGSKKIKKKTR